LVFSPDGVSTAQLLTELALGLTALGHEITVLTSTPHHSLDLEARGRQPLRKKFGGLVQESNCDGARVLHVRMREKGSRVWSRVVDYACFHTVSVVVGTLLRERFDVVLTPSPPLTMGVGARLIGALRKVPFVYNVQEIYPDVAVGLGILRNRTLIRAMRGLERYVYRQAAKVVVISEYFRRNLLAKGVPADKVVLIPNFVDTEFMQPGPRANRFSDEHGLQGAFTVLYAGNLGLTQGWETVLKAARLVAAPEVRIVLVGDGARRAWLAREVAERGLDRVELLPYQPRSAIPAMYAASDVGLVPMRAGAARDTFPSKVYTIMAAGRPVIACTEEDSALALVVRDAGCGYVVPPDDAEGLAAAVEQARSEPGRLEEMGRRGREYVEAKHSRRVVAALYDRLLRELVREGAE
jgi:colanic acid biosynthesis glycosyl transferase WcaI